MVIFQYNLYIIGIHLCAVLYPKLCYNKPCYKEVVVYSNMTLTFFPCSLWKCHRDQCTLIHIVNIVSAKWCLLLTFLLQLTSTAKEFFGKHCNNVCGFSSMCHVKIEIFLLCCELLLNNALCCRADVNIISLWLYLHEFTLLSALQHHVLFNTNSQYEKLFLK